MTSTVAIGRAYEQHAAKFLNHHLNMCVRRVGGSGDEGIDLRGFWFLPPGATRTVPPKKAIVTGGTSARMVKWDLPPAHQRAPMPGWGKATGNEGDGKRSDQIGQLLMTEQEEAYRKIRVLAQCKAENNPLSSRPIREMEGVMAHFHGQLAQAGPHQYDVTGRKLDRIPPSTISIVISRAGFSPNATTRAWRSPSPMMLVHLPGGSAVNPNEQDDGVGEEGIGMRVIGCWCNPALTGLKGLLGGTTEIRREILPEGTFENSKAPRDQWRVWYKGARLGRVGPSIEETVGSRALLS